ncbi:hypothetical protein D3C81_1990710 [compost metagenome]
MVATAHRHDGNQTGIAEHIDAGIAELQRATVRFGIHGGQLFLLDRLHAHAAGMERETLRAHQLAGGQHGGDLGFHGGVGTRDDLTDPENFLHL